ncbi:Hypothetical protein PBC10988_27690 [Planctomycetales bacterium 10988]|nr:Hypothetical protein PBC10988_27690 [Planctomycetales bacterium 10988]
MFSSWLKSSQRGNSQSLLHLETLEPRLLLDAQPYQVTNINAPGQNLSDMIEIGQDFYFKRTTAGGAELWITDGTVAGTELLKAIGPAGAASEMQSFVNADGILYFLANDGTHGVELWKSDGTSSGTQLVIDLVKDGGDAGIQELTAVGNLVFFSADGSNGRELWKSDGTAAGTTMVKNLTDDTGSEGIQSSSPESLVNVGGILFFTANDGTSGREIWATDGSDTNTFLLKEIAPNEAGSDPLYLTNINSTLFFQANDGSSGQELWVSNGESSGTYLLKDINANGSSNPNFFVEANGTIFFTAENGTNGVELWSTDGTSTGTQLVKNINASGDSNPYQLTNAGGNLYFVAEGSANNPALWKSDGTSDGTVLVKDIHPGSAPPQIEFIEFVTGTVYFSANDGVHGRELWRTRGTSETTELVSDLLSGSGSSNPQDLISRNGTLYFLANDGVGGVELWSLDSIRPGLLISPNGTATANSMITFTFQFSEEVTGFTASDIQVTNGTKGTFSTVDATTYTLIVNATENGFVTVNVAENIAQDISTNGNTAASASVLYDNSTPQLSITPDGIETNSTLITFTFQFSEGVTGFTAGDIQVSNGTKGTFESVSATIYTLEVTPGNEGEVALQVGENVAFDSFGVGNAAANASIDFDNTNPTLKITSLSDSTNNSPITFTFQFSEEVVGFSQSDLQLSNATVNNFSAIDSDTYTLSVNPIADGTVTVTVGMNVAQDAAGNGNTSDSKSVTFDGSQPQLSITPDGITTNNSPIQFTFQFSEIVTGFTVSDIIFNNAALNTFSAVDGDTYLLSVNPTSNGTITVQVSENVAQDSFGNGNTSASATVIFDTSLTGLAITPNAVSTDRQTVQFTFSFEDDVTGFTSSDIQVTNGSKGTFSELEPNLYVLEVTANTEGTVSLSVAEAAAMNGFGNGNSAATASIIFDETDPGLTITPSGGQTNDDPILFTFQFTEEVTGFLVTDIDLTNGSPGTFTKIDGANYTLSVFPDMDGTVTVSVSSGKAADLATNGNTSATASITFDDNQPNLTITPSGTQTNSYPILFTFQFSEAVSGFDLSDIEVTNGTKGIFTTVDTDTYTLEISPLADGNVSVFVAEEQALDASNNGNTEDSATVVYDGTAPLLTIIPNEDTFINTSPIVFTFQFTEAVTGFSTDDIVLTNGIAGVFTQQTSQLYTLVVTPSSQGQVTVQVNADAAEDAFFNGNEMSSASILFDSIPPSLEITPNQSTTAIASILFTFTFTEDVTGFELSDIQLTNATAGQFSTQNGSVYTLTATAIAEGDVLVSVNAEVAEDFAGNLNTSASASVSYDPTAPGLTITPDTETLNNSPIEFTFQFTESVFNFDVADIQVTNGTPGAFTEVDADTYTLLVTPTGQGTVKVNVSENIAEDATGNGNLASTASVTFDSIHPLLTITPDDIITNQPTVTFTFSFTEEVLGFEASDINVLGGTGQNFMMVQPDRYTIEIIPSGEGLVTVGVSQNAAMDAAENGNNSSFADVQFDFTSPLLAITPHEETLTDELVTFTFSFTEEVSGFSISDISVIGGIAENFVQIEPDFYTLDVVVEKDGLLQISVADNAAYDDVGNGNLSASATVNRDRFRSLIVTGADAGGGPHVRVFEPNGAEVLSFFPYHPNFTGGVRVATGDINGDGHLDIVTAPGSGGGPHIKVFDSRTGGLLSGVTNNFYAFEPTFTGGVTLAVGDVNGDGFDDIITGAGATGGPRVTVFSGANGSILSDFFAYEPTFYGGIRVAAGDLTGDGKAEIITSPGPGGGPRVRVFDGSSGDPMLGSNGDFFAYNPGFLGGLFVASGDINGDGFDDIITSPDATGGPHVVVRTASGQILQNFFAYDPNFLGGVRVAVADLNGDGFDDLLTGPGSPGGPHVRGFSGRDLADLANFFAYNPLFNGGIFLAGGVSLQPEVSLMPASSPLKSLAFTETPSLISNAPIDPSNADPVGSWNVQLQKKQRSWIDSLDEFYAQSEAIDELFSGLGIR